MEEETALCGLFIKKLASNLPAPGGGGAAALVGAAAAALAAMAANITLGAQQTGKLAELRDKAEELADRLTRLIEEDAEGFLPILKAGCLPAGTQEEKEERTRQLELAKEGACRVPLQIMKSCGEAACLCEQILSEVKPGVQSDVGVGAALVKASAEAASLNVFANTKYMKDKARAEELNREVSALLAEIADKAERLFLQVKSRLTQ